MNLKFENPRDIYDKINYELTLLVASLSSASSDEDLNRAQEDARDKIIGLQIALKNKLEQLERNSEWDTFTIAFYGETGAGKSTLIETLRILLNEPTKLEKREQFRKLRLAYEQNASLLPKLEDELESVNNDLEQLQQQLDALTDSFNGEVSTLLQDFETTQSILVDEQLQLENKANERKGNLLALNKVVADLQKTIIEKKAQASFWQKIMFVFKKLPEELEFIKTIEKLPQAEAEFEKYAQELAVYQQKLEEVRVLHDEQHANLVQKFEHSCQSLGREKRLVEQTRLAVTQQFESVSKQIGEQISEMEHCADGEIIGDGRADFTRKTQCYGFNVEQSRFNLLDVPGIEGKEGLVLEEIEKAVQAAHAVFYVTNKAAPPQTGENERKGTLEKIKEHLSAQTEVWSIFNKKITNPKYTLKNKELLSDDEQASLADMDNKMAEQLGKNYKGSFPLTALPAFVASTDCFVPNSQMSKRRDKFLEDFSEEELSEHSRLNAFIQMLKNELLSDSQNKISTANFSKVRGALDVSINSLDDIESIYKKVADDIQGNSESARHQLQASFGILNSQLQGKGHDLIRKTVQTARKRLYAAIEDDISKDEFKQDLENQISWCLYEVKGQLPLVIESVIKEFELSVESIFKRFSELSQDFLTAAGKLGTAKLDPKFNIKIELNSGVNKTALVGALIAAVMAPITAGTSLWLAGAAAFSAVVAFGKAIWSALSTDFKMSEQRKSVDINLHNVEEQLKTALEECLDEANTGMFDTVSKLDASLHSPVKQMLNTSGLLKNSNQSLKLLSKQIEKIGEL